MYIIIVNGGVYEGKYFENEGEVKEVLNEWSGGEEMKDEEDEVVSFEDLLESGRYGESVEIWNESMVEMGDEFVNVSVVELKK